jgi:hypothetical protein
MNDETLAFARPSRSASGDPFWDDDVGGRDVAMDDAERLAVLVAPIVRVALPS